MLSNAPDYHKSYKDHFTNEEIHNTIQDAIGKHDDLFSIVKKCTQYLKILWYYQDSKRNKKENKTKKEVGRQHKSLNGTGIW